MRLGVFFLALVSLVVLGIWTVGERARATRMAYELGALRAQVAECERGNRTLREEAARLSGPSRLVDAAKGFRLELVEPALAVEAGDGRE